MLRALPFDEPDRLVMGRATLDGRVNPSVSGYDYYDYQVAVRTAIGASRWSLVRQFLVESTLLSVAAGAVGLGLAVGLQRLLIELLPVGRLGIDSAGIDGAVLLFVLALSMATGLVFGTLPAFCGSVVDLSAQLKSAARTTEGRSGSRLRSGLVVVQVALGVVLLIGAGLLIRSLARQADIDLGFAPANVLTAGVRVSERDYPGVEQRIGFFTSLVDEVRVLQRIPRFPLPNLPPWPRSSTRPWPSSAW